ncbi:hypothetical protein NQZ68_035951 [Dissostichus eleginoides]|nr:hypothetical protein NQZ68_035951 [Dissostichus eleginoides]
MAEQDVMSISTVRALASGQQRFTSPQLSRMPFSRHFIPVYMEMERVSDPNAAEARPGLGLSVGQLLRVFLWTHFSPRPPSQPISLHPQRQVPTPLC